MSPQTMRHYDCTEIRPSLSLSHTHPCTHTHTELHHLNDVEMKSYQTHLTCSCSTFLFCQTAITNSHAKKYCHNTEQYPGKGFWASNSDIEECETGLITIRTSHYQHPYIINVYKKNAWTWRKNQQHDWAIQMFLYYLSLQEVPFTFTDKSFSF